MKRKFSGDATSETGFADRAARLADQGRMVAVAAKGFALEVREIYYIVAPLLEKLRSK